MTYLLARIVVMLGIGISLCILAVIGSHGGAVDAEELKHTEDTLLISNAASHLSAGLGAKEINHEVPSDISKHDGILRA